MSQKAELEEVITFIKEGDDTLVPPVDKLQYGETISNTNLARLNIPTSDPASTINPFLSDPTASINDPGADGGFNCLMYDNTKGLINNFSKDPTICSQNKEATCALSAFTDASNDKDLPNKKTYAEYKALIGDGGLNMKREVVSCGDKTNITMWVYKDAQSANLAADAIGIPVNQCTNPSFNLNEYNLETSTDAIQSLCNQEISYALVPDEVTGAGWKCKVLPPDTIANNPTRSKISPFKCLNI
jgi:hypothetical protein